MKTEVVWDDKALARIMKSEEVGVALLEHARETARECDARARRYLHSPMREQLAEAEVHTLRNTKVAVVHPSTNAGAAINRAHGTLRW